MAFPRVVLTELKVGSTDWANVSNYVFSARDKLTITRGLPGEGASAPPSQSMFALNNAGGLFSPRNPLSPFYGLVGRNTPVRHSIGRGAFGLVLVEGGNGSGWASDTVATSITGDTDIRVDMEVLADSVQSWTGVFDVASKWEDNDPGRSWKFDVAAGYPTFTWYSLGTVASMRQVTGTAPVPGPTTGRRALRVTIDVDNGAGGVDVRFYTAPNMAGTWTQLGSTVTQATTTAIFNSNAGTRFGAAAFMNTATHVTIYEGQLRNGIGGTLVANPKFYLQPLDPVPLALSSFPDGLGNTWLMIGSADAARIWYGDVAVRAVGELASLPSEWDASEKDAVAPRQAAGILRRLGQGSAPAATGLRDFITNGATTVAGLPLALQSYWPLSGAEGTKYSLNLGRAKNLVTRFYAENGPSFTYGKDMGPYLGQGMELNDTGSGTSPGDPAMRADIQTSDDNAALDFVWQSPAFGVLTVVLQDYDSNRWTLTMNTPADAGTLQVGFTAGDTGTGFGFSASGLVPELQDTDSHHCRFQVITNTPNTEYYVYIDGALVKSGTMPGYLWSGGTNMVRWYYERYSPQTVMNMAHVALWSHTSPGLIPSASDMAEAASGYAGETAGDRITRVAEAGSIPLTFVGDPDATTVMGPQHSEGKLSQIRDAEGADLGILAEPRDALGLMYITRESLYNRTPAVTLDYSLGQVGLPFRPIDDDQSTRNDITAVRRDGGSYRNTLMTGALSVLDPPLGVGPYEDEVTTNVATDAQLPGQAAWLLSRGTVDEARYPTLTVDLHSPGIVAAGLDNALLAVDVGDVIRVINADTLNIYDDLDLMVLGYTEEITDGGFRHSIVFNCQPASPYQVAVYGTSVSVGTDRWDTGGSTLAAGVSSSATSLSVATIPGAALWTNDSAAFPFDINVGGERITVTNITGTSSPQTFGPVVRAVNGVAKAQSANAPVRLWKTPRYAL